GNASLKIETIFLIKIIKIRCFRMLKKFPDIIEKQFSDLLHEFYELEAELNKLKCVSKTTYQNLLKEKNYEEFERLIGIMYRTSSNQSETFERMHRACLEVHKYVNKTYSGEDPGNNKKKVRELIAKIKEGEKQGLVFAERLPFSLGEGWMPQGGISNLRRIVNIPGYLLLAPYLVATKRQNLTMLEKSLYDLRKSVIKNKPGQSGYDPKELEKSMQDFKIFIRLTNQLHRKFRRLHKECKRIYTDLYHFIDEEIVYGKTDVGSQWKAV
ncbi:MAG TPA: hypothetical protein VJA23_06470, partial [Candidatus Nanoarchaeia archaeon]|nr:hypothetical protein [Candidatus Nanoarchaeia archaeon]